MDIAHSRKPYLQDRLRCACCLNEDPNGFQEKWQKNGFIVLECNQCSFDFIPWHYRKDITYTDYKNEAVLQQIRAGNDWLKVQRHLLRFRFIRRYRKEGRLFDLGAGWGHFLLAGKQLGYEVSGIEISLNPYLYAKEDLKLPVEHVDFFQWECAPESFDIVTMWDVLEHIDEADRFVAKCASLLKKGGYLFIQVPQIDSFFARRQQEKWNMMSLDHVNYFSTKTLPILLERHGLETMKIKSSIELKLLLMYTILPWIQKRKGKKQETISSAERQEFYNKTTRRPKWVLRLMVALHNILYTVLSGLRIGEEMIVVARKK